MVTWTTSVLQNHGSILPVKISKLTFKIILFYVMTEIKLTVKAKVVVLLYTLNPTTHLNTYPSGISAALMLNGPG